MATTSHPQYWRLTSGLSADGTKTGLARSAAPAVRERGTNVEADVRRRGLPLRVLIVEDYSDAGESLAILLRLSGHEVEVAPDGAAAARKAAGNLPNVLLVDIGLPGEDGYTVAKQLSGLLPAKPLLIALTGYGEETDRQRSRDEGFDCHLVKPYDPCELECLLEQFASEETFSVGTLLGDRHHGTGKVEI